MSLLCVLRAALSALLLLCCSGCMHLACITIICHPSSSSCCCFCSSMLHPTISRRQLDRCDGPAACYFAKPSQQQLFHRLAGSEPKLRGNSHARLSLQSHVPTPLPLRSKLLKFFSPPGFIFLPDFSPLWDFRILPGKMKA